MGNDKHAGTDPCHFSASDQMPRASIEALKSEPKSVCDKFIDTMVITKEAYFRLLEENAQMKQRLARLETEGK